MIYGNLEKNYVRLMVNSKSVVFCINQRFVNEIYSVPGKCFDKVLFFLYFDVRGKFSACSSVVMWVYLCNGSALRFLKVNRFVR